jgi:hypothetical protein
MQTGDLIPASEFCVHCEVEFSFIQSLEQSGLIQITTVGGAGYIHTDQLQELEKWIRLHQEMDINVEGIEAVSHLLERIQGLQDELTGLKNRLRLYEIPS